MVNCITKRGAHLAQEPTPFNQIKLPKSQGPKTSFNVGHTVHRQWFLRTMMGEIKNDNSTESDESRWTNAKWYWLSTIRNHTESQLFGKPLSLKNPTFHVSCLWQVIPSRITSPNGNLKISLHFWVSNHLSAFESRGCVPLYIYTYIYIIYNYTYVPQKSLQNTHFPLTPGALAPEGNDTVKAWSSWTQKYLNDPLTLLCQQLRDIIYIDWPRIYEWSK